MVSRKREGQSSRAEREWYSNWHRIRSFGHTGHSCRVRLGMGFLSLWFGRCRLVRRMALFSNDSAARTSTELDHIEANAPADGIGESPPVIFFLKSKAVWAIVVAHFCNNWTLYVILSWLPKYVNDGLGVPFAAIGLIAMLPHITSFLCLNIMGNIADRLIEKGWSVTFVRKLMQTIAFGGLAICLLLITQVEEVWRCWNRRTQRESHGYRP